MSHFNQVAEKFLNIQERACEIIETCDGKSLFSRDSWQKEIGSGLTRVMQFGDKVEKGAINFSKVQGKCTPTMNKTLGTDGEMFSATGVSSIFHPKNPWTPIIHMNIRYFELNTGEHWFGGGIDLTPHYVDVDEAANFHTQIKAVCDAFHPEFYADFKKQADDYFYLLHRNETRGVGGIFFDHLKPNTLYNFNTLLNFTLKLGELYPVLYGEILENKSKIPYTQNEVDWQHLRRSRYVEFNLIYDRGTKFGLESGGNTESILLSMPPSATWAYNYTPNVNSNEEKTMNFLKKGINWLNK